MRLLSSALFFSLGLALGTLGSDLGSRSHQTGAGSAYITANQSPPAAAPIEGASLAPASGPAEPLIGGDRCEATAVACAADVHQAVSS